MDLKRKSLRTAITIASAICFSAQAGTLAAQTGTPKPYVFSGQAKAALDRLALFQAIPAETWQYHAGDIAHGERRDLDTSGWQTVHLPFTAPRGAVWFRRTVEVPKTLHGYDITGAQIWFQMNVDANGSVPVILYYNGQRVALGEDLEKQPLFNDAKPGDKILVAVKMLVTQDTKRFRRADLPVVFSGNRPNPEDLRKELISAADLLPAITTDSNALASQEKTLDQVAASIDVSALDGGNQAAFDASVQQAQSKLESLRPILQKYSVHMTGNAHIDAAWLWPWTETVDVVKRTFSSALQLMNEYPDYTYSQSAAQYYEWMQQKYPSIFQQIQQRVKEGRWEIVGGMWVEPDLNLPDGESQVRQILVGKRYFQKNFGVDVRVGWNPDSFGYNWQLPQIYKKSGIDYFVTQKMTWNDTDKLPLKLFWWQSPDGSRVLTYFPHDYVNQIEPARMARDLATAIELNPGQKEMMHLYGIGDHGGGPTRDMLDSGVRWMEPNKIFPHLEFGVSQNFFNTMAQRIEKSGSPVWNYENLAAGNTALPAPPEGKISLPVWNDELYLEFHRGVYTTQAKHKWNLRHSSEWLLNAEKYSSLAWLGGATYPGDKLTEGWKLVSFNGFHDLAAGSGIGVIYKDAQKQFDVVHWTANDATRRALRGIDSQINTTGKGDAKAGVPIIVWNTMSWGRTDVVEAHVQMPQPTPNGISVLDPDGTVVPAQVLAHDPTSNSYRLLLEPRQVPSVGYVVLHAIAGKRPLQTDLKTNGLTMENEFLKVVVNPTNGCIDSLYDKQAHFESIAAGQCGNMLQAFVDTPKEYDAWNINPNFAEHGTNLTMADSVQLAEHGPVRSIVRVTRHWDKSTFIQNIVLYAGMQRVDVVNDVDWHETHILLKAAFPLAASGPKATFEIPYGTIERPTTRNNSVEKAKFEVPAQRWADLGDGQHGFSLINDSKYGYDVKGNVLRLSLLRSPVWPDPDADRGPQHFRYSLYPHAGTWKQADTVLHGYAFNYKLHAMQTQQHDGELPSTHSFVSVHPSNLVLTAMKKSEDGDSLILRFYEWAGRKTDAKIQVPAGANAAVTTNLMEHADGLPVPVVGNQMTVPVGPYSINTVRVEYGNRGAGFWHAQK
ncbi:MAG TPA: glycoside hydrolase family 38 C-terminal domain-containing protein [Acidobacteriaceae bacterium]|nr:glycoside hydrolase family 38 C-terminal domain-containing protein [Acidobacteriaceae bacterium]